MRHARSFEAPTSEHAAYLEPSFAQADCPCVLAFLMPLILLSCGLYLQKDPR